MPPHARRSAGRPHDEGSTAAILAVTLRVVAERGYEAAGLDEIVARAGSSKPTLYRRWSSKPALVADAIRAALATATPAAPRTADALADVATILRNTIVAVTRTPLGGAVRALVGAAENNPELARCLKQVEGQRRAILRDTLARARPRWSRRRLDLEVDRLLGAIYFRYLIRRLPLAPGWARELIDPLRSPP